MAQRTPRIATVCGHEYVWHFRPPRAYCQDCVWEMGRRFDKENREARRAAAEARRPGSRAYIPPSVRQAIYERDGWVCQLCLDPVDRADLTGLWAASLDHIIPFSQGGTDEPENLRLAHRWCNSVRGDERCWTAADLAPPTQLAG